MPQRPGRRGWVPGADAGLPARPCRRPLAEVAVLFSSIPAQPTPGSSGGRMIKLDGGTVYRPRLVC